MAVIVSLNCGHQLYFKKRGWVPTKGTEVFCPQCRLGRRVDIAPPSYTVRCQDCRFSRATYGHVRSSAERDITDHMTRHPTHTMQLWDGQQLEHTFTPHEKA